MVVYLKKSFFSFFKKMGTSRCIFVGEDFENKGIGTIIISFVPLGQLRLFSVYQFPYLKSGMLGVWFYF